MTSSAFVDNAASAAISRSLGYVENGVDRHAPLGEVREATRFLMTADAWRSRERPPIEVDGFDECREFFGV